MTTAELSPFVVGIVYCGVILACQAGFEVGRAREWTLELTRWVEQQRDLVAFTGRCLVHRAEILQLGGSWSEALEEARLAAERFVETKNPAAGLALYRQGELLRLRGEFAAAEEAYRDASRNGWEPQPGLAQLRLAQGKRDAALAAIRRACAEVTEPLKRAALLPAQVEIALAAGEVEEARTACLELRELAKQYESAMLDAIVAHAEGAVALAEGDAPSALASLRHAQRIWLELDAPYEVARTRELIAQACSRVSATTRQARSSCEAARELFERLGAAPDLARVSTRQARATGCRSASSRSCGSSPRGRATARSPRRSSSASTPWRGTCRTSTRSSGVSSRAAATAFAFEHELV